MKRKIESANTKTTKLLKDENKLSFKLLNFMEEEQKTERILLNKKVGGKRKIKNSSGTPKKRSNVNSRSTSQRKSKRKTSKSRRPSEDNTNALNDDESISEFDAKLNKIVLSIANINNLANKSSTQNKKKETEKFENFPYDNSIHKELQIEISVELDSKDDAVQVSEVLVQILDTFFKNNPLYYYEYSNPRNKSSYINSSIDNINYDFLYQKKDISIEGTNKTNSLIKDINYLSAFSSVFKTYIRNEVLNEHDEFYNNECNENFFYLVSPLVSYYFFKYERSDFFTSSRDEINYSGVVISNQTRLVDRLLKEYEIKYDKISIRGEEKLKKNEDKTIPLFSLPNNSTEVEVMSNFIQGSDSVNSDYMIFVKNQYSPLLFNALMNESQDSSINIFSPSNFDSSTLRIGKINIQPFIKDESINVCVKIHGCIFYSYLYKIINFMTKDDKNKNKKDDSAMKLKEMLKSKGLKNGFTFNLKLHPFMKTSNFYAINKRLKGPIDTAEYRNEAFYIKIQN